MPRMTRRLLAAGAVLFAIASAGIVSAESNGGVRVMPLGDSITDGYPTAGGYRIGLWQRFGSGGHVVDFVGSAFNGPAALADHDHEGHSGWRIDQIHANIAAWLRATNPHTVLLHIGTNDLNQNFDVANAPARLSALVDRILATAPGVEVFVAQITPTTNTTVESRIRTYNAAIPGRMQGKGSRVHVVNMHDVITTADLADGLHPNPTGYTKMAAAWYAALLSVPNSLRPTGPAVGSPVTLVNSSSGRCLDVNGGSTTAGTGTILFDCGGGANQRWTRTAARELRIFGSSCLDVFAGGTTNGTRAIIWPCHGGANQQWIFRPNGSIISASTNKCLDVNSAGTANGVRVQLWDCNSSAAQQWGPR